VAEVGVGEVGDGQRDEVEDEACGEGAEQDQEPVVDLVGVDTVTGAGRRAVDQQGADLHQRDIREDGEDRGDGREDPAEQEASGDGGQEFVECLPAGGGLIGCVAGCVIRCVISVVARWGGGMVRGGHGSPSKVCGT
jgi:hypothetical protein